jgi:hypothetical protein
MAEPALSRCGRCIANCYRSDANSYLHKYADFAMFCDEMRQVGAYWLGLNHYR